MRRSISERKKKVVEKKEVARRRLARPKAAETIKARSTRGVRVVGLLEMRAGRRQTEEIRVRPTPVNRLWARPEAAGQRMHKANGKLQVHPEATCEEPRPGRPKAAHREARCRHLACTPGGGSRRSKPDVASVCAGKNRAKSARRTWGKVPA